MDRGILCLGNQGVETANQVERFASKGHADRRGRDNSNHPPAIDQVIQTYFGGKLAGNKPFEGAAELRTEFYARSFRRQFVERSTLFGNQTTIS